MSFSVNAAAAESPDAPFIVTAESTLSFAEVAARVNWVADWLCRRGIGVSRSPYPVVAQVDEPSVLTLLALFELGVPALLLHPRWTESERDAYLEVAGAELTERPPRQAFEPRHPALPSAATTAHDDHAPLAIVPTSGSRGTPRGVILSRSAFAASARASASVLGWAERDRWLLSLPCAHIGGLSILTRCLLGRRALALPRDSESFSAAGMRSTVDSQQVTLLSLVPTQLQALLDQDERAPGSLRAVLLGGAAAAPSLVRRARRANWPVLCTYGMSEACSTVTLERPGASFVDGASGPPLPGVELDFADGRIRIRCASLLSGYLREDHAPLDADGWLVTQDHGELREGNLVVHGRADETIVTGGENVHPAEVERVLLEHPLVDQACVFGVVDERWGEVVCAALVMRAEGSAADLWRWLQPRMAPHKLPRQVALLERLPQNPNGKVSRVRCQQMAAPALRSIAPPRS